MINFKLIPIIIVSTFTIAHADSIFSMGDIMDKMTDAAKTIKTEISEATTGIKDTVTNTVDEVKEYSNKTEEADITVRNDVNKTKDAPVTESIELFKDTHKEMKK